MSFYKKRKEEVETEMHQKKKSVVTSTPSLVEKYRSEIEGLGQKVKKKKRRRVPVSFTKLTGTKIN